MTQNMNERLKFFVPFNIKNKFTSLFFNIDETNNLHIQRTMYQTPNVLTSIEYRLSPIPIDEFFACHRDPISERELKGIFYDKKAKRFYLFINRFFRKLKKDFDLVEENFKLPFPATFDSLKFDERLNPEFEVVNSKYVKSAGDTSYLATSIGFVFELNAENLDEKFTQLEKNIIDRCPKQTLLVEGEVFCFGEADYYHLTNQDGLTKTSDKEAGRKRIIHRIAEIFQGTGIKYGDTQKLKFIFNYLKNQFVFVTNSNLFVFNYEKFSVNTEAKRITTRYTNVDSVPMKINCLLDPFKPNCDQKGLTTTSARPTYPVTFGTPVDVIRSNLDIIIISFLVLLLVLILLTFVIVRTIQSKKRPMIKYNLYMKGMEGLSRLGSSFASRIFKKKSTTGLPPAASPKKKAESKNKAKSVSRESASVVSSHLTVGSRKSMKSVNYSNPQSKSPPSKRDTEQSEVGKKKKSAYLS